jgi:hypothetical protein
MNNTCLSVIFITLPPALRFTVAARSFGPVIDRIQRLKLAGADMPSDMQWQTETGATIEPNKGASGLPIEH